MVSTIRKRINSKILRLFSAYFGLHGIRYYNIAESSVQTITSSMNLLFWPVSVSVLGLVRSKTCYVQKSLLISLSLSQKSHEYNRHHCRVWRWRQYLYFFWIIKMNKTDDSICFVLKWRKINFTVNQFSLVCTTGISTSKDARVRTAISMELLKIIIDPFNNM